MSLFDHIYDDDDVCCRFTKYFQHSNRSLQEVLNEITDNTDLRAVLAYSFGDYGKYY